MSRTMRGVLFMAFVLAVHSWTLVAASPSLKRGFYKKTCPQAERIVRNVVGPAVAANPGIGAGLIRLHFHDCFVRGCDASVLLEGGDSEQMNIANLNSLRGFEAINDAKALLESECPQTVSCADVLAFAARDASEFTGGPTYKVPAGRRDGRISRREEANVLPSPLASAQELRDDFTSKGLSLEDMVVLSGAHSLGIAHCPTFSRRLYNFNATHPQDPSMAPDLAEYLKRRCPPPGQDRTAVPLDVATPNLLDVQYYRNLKKGKGVLISDQTLWTSSLTAKMVDSFADKPNRWAKKYADAMVRMGAMDVLTGNQGEIRIRCAVVNSY
ncbi:peroxidase 5-like [Wolffia australiana]